MEFFYQPYLLQSLVPHEPDFKLDYSTLHQNPNESLHLYNQKIYKINLFHNYLQFPIFLSIISENIYIDFTIKESIKKNILKAFDEVFIFENERGENIHLVDEIIELIQNNKFVIYDASTYFDKQIKEKSAVFIIEAAENAHLFTPTIPLKTPIEIEEERLVIDALATRIAFLHELGVMEFLEKKWKLIDKELLENRTSYAKLLAVFMNVEAEKIRNVIKDNGYQYSEYGKKTFDKITQELKIIKKI